MSRPVNANHLRFGDLLIPKRGRDLDPLIVTQLWRIDKRARVKDAAVCSNDPGWNENRVADTDGTFVKTFAELNRNYYIAAPDDRPSWIEHLNIKWGGDRGN